MVAVKTTTLKCAAGEPQQLLLELTGELLFLIFQHRHLLLDGIALLAEFGYLVAFGISARLNALADFLADPVAFCLQVAALLLQIALLLGNQLQFGEINSLTSTPQLLGDRFGVVTHKALIEHGFRGVSAGAGADAPETVLDPVSYTHLTLPTKA